MGLLDTIKGAVKGKQHEIDKGLDAAVKFAKGKAPAKYDSKIDSAAKHAKKAANKLAGTPKAPTAEQPHRIPPEDETMR